MRKIWLVLFPALLLLCGCTTQKPEVAPAEVTAPTFFTTEPTEPVGFYQPDSPVEVCTNGAIQVFPLDIPDAAGFRFLGEDILLFSGSDHTTLTLLGGSRRYVKTQLELSHSVSAENPAVVVSAQGVTYVAPETHELIFLNESLKEISRIPLPEECGNLVLSKNRSKLYYCTDNALRVLDLETGIDRMLKEMYFPSQKLLGLHCDDTVIQCCATFDDGSQHTLFFHEADGSLLYETAKDIPLWTQGDTYFATHRNGAYQELISGSRQDEPMLLVPEADYDGMVPILSQNALLMHRQNEYGQTVLDCYSLESGLHFAQAVLPGSCRPKDIQADPSSGRIWFLCTDSSNQDLLCAWDPSRSATNSDTYYLQPRYDRDNPDLEGLDACKLLARDLSIKHDVQIFIWRDATALQPWDYTLVPEYQVPLIRKKLLQLDEILSNYPAGFLKEAASQTGNGRLTICLVRSINGNPNTNALATAVGLQYWDQDARAYLAITPGDDMARHIYHELFHIIDSRVLSSCSAYDNWNKLNPKGFSYGSDTSEHKDLTLGENRYFIDLYSTRYAKEDRARIMEYAMLDGQQEVFQSASMQAKLRQLCLGIREAFGLQSTAEGYHWEQYLHTPLSSGK